MFSGKKILITGSNRGIGNAMLHAFASEGASIIAHARKSSQDFDLCIEKIRNNYGVEVDAVYFDVTNTEQMKDVMKSVLQKKDNLDILVNNAGVAHGGFFSMTKVQTIRDVFEVNLFAAMELTQIVLRKMIRQKSGSIINMSSIAAFDLLPGNSAYGVSKAAVRAWTETLSAEVAPYGIRVNAIAPGLVDTNMAKLMETKAGEDMLQASAMARLARPSEIADVAMFLASDRASFVNGQTVVVNGGRA